MDAIKLCSFLFLFALLLPVSPAPAGQASIFVYHRFGDDRYPSTNISIDVFAAQLQLLKEKSHVVLPLDEVVRSIREGRELPERCTVLTVDDAYVSFLTGAMPLLRRYGYPVTLFVSTGSVGRPGYLNWDQLRSLAREGVAMGNHTVSHPYLLNRKTKENNWEWRQRVWREIAEAQEKLERELGEAPSFFAYPYGEYAPEVVEIVREFGFPGALGQQSGVAYSGSDPSVFPRFPMGGPYATLEGFEQKAAMKALPVQVISPASPVVEEENPPTLEIRIEAGGIDLTRLRCFVQGQEEGEITPVPGDAGRFRVRAVSPLAGRRNKYTLTAPGRGTGQWYWFSQLWVFTDRPDS
jgi:peptidoglycan/xylan/chitin deacetylase (PgdA/CDA1 family)